MGAGQHNLEKERDRSYWDRHAARYDASVRTLLARPMPRMLELVAEACRGAPRVLELAAGTGLVTEAIAPVASKVTATDYADGMVTRLVERVQTRGFANVTCERADLYALSYEPHSFDVVVAANVLHLVPDLPGAISAMTRVLRPGGKLVVPTFCHDQTLVSAVVSRVLAVTGFPGHRRFTAQSLCAAVEERDLRIARSDVLPGVIPIGYVET